VIVRSAGGEGLGFPMALEGDPGERAAGIIALWPDIDDEAGIGVEFGAGILAHAVGDDVAFLAGGGDDPAARAHAERIDGATIAAGVREGIGGGAEQLVARERPVAGSVDPALRVFDPHADRESLGLDMDAAMVKLVEADSAAFDVKGGKDSAVIATAVATAVGMTLPPDIQPMMSYGPSRGEP